jgi:hypothetical protein
MNRRSSKCRERGSSKCRKMGILVGAKRGVEKARVVAATGAEREGLNLCQMQEFHVGYAECSTCNV